MSTRTGSERANPLALLWAWLPALVIMALILGFSSFSGSPIPRLGFAYADKLTHAAIYMVLGALTLRALWLSSPRWGGGLLVVAVILLVSGFGGLDEFYQGFVPHRTPEWGDWLADTLGGTIGATIMWGYRLLRGRKKGRAPDG